MVIPGARRAIESLYEDTCTITVTSYAKDAVTKKQSPTDTVAVEDQPCRLSFSSVTVPKEDESSAEITQAVKLFIAPEVAVPPGSKIVVTRRDGTVRRFRLSGLTAMHTAHQEIPLVADEGRA